MLISSFLLNEILLRRYFHYRGFFQNVNIISKNASVLQKKRGKGEKKYKDFK